MNLMYTNQTQQSQQQQQSQKPHIQEKFNVVGNTVNAQQVRSTLSPSLVAGVTPMQAGQILNLGTANHGVGGQILNLPNGPTGGGQFYVMIPQSPVDVNHQKIAPRAHGAVSLFRPVPTTPNKQPLNPHKLSLTTRKPLTSSRKSLTTSKGTRTLLETRSPFTPPPATKFTQLAKKHFKLSGCKQGESHAKRRSRSVSPEMYVRSGSVSPDFCSRKRIVSPDVHSRKPVSSDFHCNKRNASPEIHSRRRELSPDFHNIKSVPLNFTKDITLDFYSDDTPLAAQRTEREEKRRQTHNEVERRRRDKINSWIHKLAKMVPNCKDELGTKHGGQMREQVTLKSKGGILQKTVNFIQELQIAHSQVVERLQEQNQVLGEMAKVRENLKRVEQENLLLRSQLQSHGFEPIDYASQSMQQSRQESDTLKSCSEMNQPPMVTLSQTSTQQSVLYGQSSTMDDKDDEQ